MLLLLRRWPGSLRWRVSASGTCPVAPAALVRLPLPRDRRPLGAAARASSCSCSQSSPRRRHRYHEWKTRPPLDLLSSTGREVTITGTVDSDLTRTSTNVSYLIEVASVTDRGKTRPADGQVQVNLDQYDHLVRGATVHFRRYHLETVQLRRLRLPRISPPS